MPTPPPAVMTENPAVLFNGSSDPVVMPDFAGLSPGVAGLYQVNVQIPIGYRPGVACVMSQFRTGFSNTTFLEVH